MLQTVSRPGTVTSDCWQQLYIYSTNMKVVLILLSNTKSIFLKLSNCQTIPLMKTVTKKENKTEL